MTKEKSFDKELADKVGVDKVHHVAVLRAGDTRMP